MILGTGELVRICSNSFSWTSSIAVEGTYSTGGSAFLVSPSIFLSAKSEKRGIESLGSSWRMALRDDTVEWLKGDPGASGSGVATPPSRLEVKPTGTVEVVLAVLDLERCESREDGGESSIGKSLPRTSRNQSRYSDA